jgi:hypothetical protein
VLGVDATSTPEAVTRAYRQLARTAHPDVSSAPDAAQQFAAIVAAYELVRASAPRSASPGGPGAEPDGQAGQRHLKQPPGRAVAQGWLHAGPVTVLLPDARGRYGSGAPRDLRGAPLVAGPVTVQPPRDAPRPSAQHQGSTGDMPAGPPAHPADPGGR